MNWLKDIAANEKLLYTLAFLLFVPSVFLGIEKLPLMSDEGIRALVALEIDLNNSFFTPTLTGVYYYNKPPLYNWIIVGFYRLFNSYSLYTFRLFNVFAGIGFGYVIYLFSRLTLDKKESLLAALLFLTCGRIYFNDFFLGLIAFTQGAVLFLNFYVIYKFGKKEKFLTLFVISYALIALTFLMKGLQGIVAQAISLPLALIFLKQWRVLFSWKHVVGIFVFVLICGIYFLGYYQSNPEGFNKFLAIIWNQSEQRTFVNYGWIEVFLHFIAYPIKLLYEILPYSFLVILFFSKRNLKFLRENEVTFFALIMFVANNLVYMLSPYWHARYVFFLFPFMFIGFVYMCRYAPASTTKLLNKFWIAIAIIACLLLIVFPFTPWANQVVELKWLSLFFALIVGVFVAMMYFQKKNSLLILVLVAITVRYAANFLFLDVYKAYIKETEHQALAVEAAKISEGEPLKLFMSPRLTSDIAYYIATQRHEVLEQEHDSVNTESFYIISTRQTEFLQDHNLEYTKFFNFKTRNENDTLFLVKFNQSKALSKIAMLED